MEILIAVVLVCGVIGAAIDGTRGAILGAALGPIGLVISAILSTKG